MTRSAELSEAAWARIEPLMPQAEGRSRPRRDHRQVVEGSVFRYRTGVAWRDLPERFGPWQTGWKRHHRFTADGTWDMLVVPRLHPQAHRRSSWAASTAVRSAPPLREEVVRPQRTMPGKEVPTPFHFHFTAHKGACGNPWVVPHNRRPKPEPTEMEVMKCVCC